MAESIDDIAVIRSLHADVPNHEPSLLLMNCGEARLIRPSLGSWVTHGLGTENQNLPGFIAMCPGGYPIQESQNWQSGFLPGSFKALTSIPNTPALRSSSNIFRTITRRCRSSASSLTCCINSMSAIKRCAGRTSSWKPASNPSSWLTACNRMPPMPSMSAVSRKKSAGCMGRGTQARQILIARRLLERGVRFVQVWHGAGQPWDNHDDIEVNHRKLAQECDQAIGALLKDLKQRGLLEETLVIWGGEFGRTPTVELPTPGPNASKINGRDHNHYGFTVWMAGGGVRGGYVHGATDEFGFQAVEKKVHVHDLHATILKLLGFDHES